MRITRIYTTQVLHSNAAITLEPSPSNHLARVLRKHIGDNVILFNGCGGEFPATITAVDKKAVHVQTRKLVAHECESDLQIHLGIAISRGERMDWVVQKATELGVSSISPLMTENTGVKLAGERAEKKLQHWQQVSINACEQCGRNRVPLVQALQNIQSWLTQTDAEQKFVLHHRANSDNEDGNTPKSIALLIGPEGGLSESEIKAAEQEGYQSLQLGPRVLRTETAPLAAIAILQARWGDMGSG